MALTEITSKGIKDADIATADIADNAITLAKMAGGTDGQIITYDASGNPTAVGPGTDGQVLTSTGAGSPPAFEDAAGGPSLANDANNRVITGTGSGLNGEANLTFDGDHLTQTIDADGEGFNQTASGNHYIKNEVDANRSSASASILSTVAKWNGKEVAGIKFTAGGDTTNKDDGRIIFETSTANDIAERVRIDTEGKVGIGTASIDNLLHVEQSGTGTTAKFQTGGRESSILIQNDARTWKIVNYDYGDNGTDHLGFHDGSSDRVIIQNTGGISFNGDTAAANALDDYEEGTFLPSIYGNSAAGTTTYHGSDNRRGHYTKIGRQVTAHFQVGWTENSGGSGDLMLGGLPFTVDATDYTDPNDTHQAFGACYFYNLACPIDSGSFLHVLSYTYGGIGTAVKFLQMQISGDALAVNMTYGGNESSSVLKYIAGSITYHVA